jgi:hypothetical protein
MREIKMPAPTRDEMTIAAYLLKKMQLDPDTRSLLASIARGDVIHAEALVMMRHLGDHYTELRKGKQDLSKTG